MTFNVFLFRTFLHAEYYRDCMLGKLSKSQDYKFACKIQGFLKVSFTNIHSLKVLKICMKLESHIVCNHTAYFFIQLYHGQSGLG